MQRVKFAPEPQNNNSVAATNAQQKAARNLLQRSKSLSSADALARGIAGLGLGLGNENTDIGKFKPEIQNVIDQALKDPNELNARSLMDLANQIMQRAVEGRR